MSDCVAIVSGGMDSVTLLHYSVKKEKRQPAILTFRYGQKHDREIEYARVQATALACTEHQIVDLTLLRSIFASSALVSKALRVPQMHQIKDDPQPPTYVPNRNMIFLALAAAYAENQGLTQVFYGAQRHDMYGYWDTTPEFLERVNQVYQLNRKTSIQIVAPLVHYSKTEILSLGLSLKVDYSQTWSCYEGVASACGQCPTCAERLQAFHNLGMVDPLPYESTRA